MYLKDIPNYTHTLRNNDRPRPRNEYQDIPL